MEAVVGNNLARAGCNGASGFAASGLERDLEKSLGVGLANRWF
jgi:hypothetical protein